MATWVVVVVMVVVYGPTSSRARSLISKIIMESLPSCVRRYPKVMASQH
ncbi:MAG TPA: hypothetical protein VI037_05080 [Nitrososphaera sp.]